MFVLWNYPPASSALLDRARNRSINDTCVVAIVQVDAVNNNKPPGYSDYGSNSAANWAKRAADHLEYQGFTRGRGTSGGGNYGGVICPLNWGLASLHIALRHASDVVGGDGCSPFGIYNANGIAAGVGTLKQWGIDAMAALKTECDSRNLCYPEIMLMDYEDRPAVQYQLRNDDVSPVDADGAWPETAAAARYNTEVLVDLPSNKTLTQLVALQPAETYTATNWYFFGLDNQAWSKKVYKPIEEKVHDRALYVTIGTAVESNFPSCLWGNYALQNATSASWPARDGNNSWLFWNQNGGTTMHATLQHPRAYGPAISGQQYDPANNATHGLGTTNQLVWRNFTLGQARACVAYGGAIMPCIETPNTVAGDVGGQYTPTNADVGWLIEQGALLGIQDWLIFNPSPPMTSQQAIDTFALIQATAAVTGGGGGGSSGQRTSMRRRMLMRR